MTKTARFLLVVLAMLVAISAVACSGGGDGGESGASSGAPAAADSLTIVAKNYAFNPSNATVKVGATVTFVNEDPTPHNVQIGGQILGPQATGESKTWKAEKAGTFEYFSTNDATMKGIITVE